MINKKEDIINFICTTFCIVLFLAVLSSFSVKPTPQMNAAFQHEIISAHLSDNGNAISIDAYQNRCFQKTFVFLHNHLFNETHKMIVDNNKITHRFISLQKTELLIKPDILLMFYHHIFSEDSKDLPILS
ncbi:MAG: hypothetical protein ACOYO1_12355 [Bacteroidales bacterium]